MKIFVSSRFKDMEALRQAASQAIRDLRHEPIAVEDFAASPQSPQLTCLEGVRASGLVVLILGDSYGQPQASGLSATHEEFREAQGKRDVIAFVQQGINPEPLQQTFIEEVGRWSQGTLYRTFRTAEELRSEVIGSISQWQLSKSAGPLDQEALIHKALGLIPKEPRNVSYGGGPRLVLAIASGPLQPILRPVEIESPALREAIQQAALFGPHRILTTKRGSGFQLDGNALRLKQEDRSDLLIDPEGGMRMRLQLPERDRHAMALALVEEDVKPVLATSIAYSAWLLDRIDATGRVTHVGLAVTFSNAGSYTWTTRVELGDSRTGFSMRMDDEAPPPVMLSPPVRARAALAQQADQLVEDLLVLLRRQWGAGH